MVFFFVIFLDSVDSDHDSTQGQNIILNMDDHGYVVTAFNRTTSKVDEFLANEAKGTKVRTQKNKNKNDPTLPLTIYISIITHR